MSKTYSDYAKEEAVAAWVTTGTYSGAGRATGISADTIRTWHDRQPTWWGEAATKIRELHEEKHRAKLTEIMDRSTDEILDRLENGDERINSKGEKYRVKVSAGDTAIILGIATEKRSLSLGLPTSISSKTESVKDRLKALRDAARPTEH